MLDTNTDHSHLICTEHAQCMRMTKRKEREKILLLRREVGAIVEINTSVAQQ